MAEQFFGRTKFNKRKKIVSETEKEKKKVFLGGNSQSHECKNEEVKKNKENKPKLRDDQQPIRAKHDNVRFARI